MLGFGSFIGIDVDGPVICRCTRAAASHCGLDTLNVLFLTPLPGSRLRKEMKSTFRLAFNSSPDDWRHYVLTFPVALYQPLSWQDIIQRIQNRYWSFYSIPRILRRASSSNTRAKETEGSRLQAFRGLVPKFGKTSIFDRSSGLYWADTDPAIDLPFSLTLEKGELSMIYTLLAVLLVLWLLGFSMSVGGNLIHALLLVAAVLFVFHFFGRSRRWN